MAKSQTIILPEIQTLAGRLHGRGTSPIGPDTDADQGDMHLAASVIRDPLSQCITAADAAAQIARQFSDSASRSGADMPMPTTTMTFADPERRADRLQRQGASHAVAEHVAAMQAKEP